MATINTFSRANQTTTDQVITDLNTNFGNLNTDKIEADSTDTLANKTINADNNTVSNINSTNCDATGVDNDIVSGTAGTADNIAKWNSDGDLVDASVAVSTTAPSGSSTNAQIPTSLAVNTAVASAVGSLNGVTSFIVVPSAKFATVTDITEDSVYTTAAANQYMPSVSLATNQIMWFYAQIPESIATLTATLYCSASTTASRSLTVKTYDFDTAGAYPSVVEDNAVISPSFTANQLTKVDISDALTYATIGSGMKAVSLQVDTSTLYAHFIKFDVTYS